MTAPLPTEPSIDRSHRQKLIDYDKQNKLKYDIRDFDRNLKSDDFEISKKEESTSEAIKTMNRLMMYAKTATIRDRQLDERKFMENMYRNKERNLETMMELERLKELQYQEMKEKKSIELKKKSSLMVVDQIKENEIARLRKKELLEREKLQMVRLAEHMAEEDKKNLLLKKEMNEQMIKEATEANRISLLNKEMERIRERENDLENMKFNRDKIKKEEELILQKKKLQEQKEKELQILRSKQEKFRDKQAELDAIRSKRAYEASEVLAREKERREKEIYEKKIKDIIEENNKHVLFKEKIENEEKQKEIDLFNKNIKELNKEIELEKENEIIKKNKRIENQSYLINQMETKAFNNNLKKKEILDEGKTIKMNKEKYKKHLELIKEQKIKELQDLNIKDKYIVDLKCLNLDKFDC